MTLPHSFSGNDRTESSLDIANKDITSSASLIVEGANPIHQIGCMSPDTTHRMRSPGSVLVNSSKPTAAQARARIMRIPVDRRLIYLSTSIPEPGQNGNSHDFGRRDHGKLLHFLEEPVADRRLHMITSMNANSRTK
jgi:hypothetical protein